MRIVQLSLFLGIISLVGCRHSYEVQLIDQKSIIYDGSYPFPSELNYLEPNIGEQAIRFNLLAEVDLLALEKKIDLNGYHVALGRCTHQAEPDSVVLSAISQLVPLPTGGGKNWAFFITRRDIDRAISEMPELSNLSLDTRYCFTISAGSMIGTSALSNELEIGESALKNMLSLANE